MARSAEKVIDAAIADNAPWEWLCYGAVLVCLVLGATVLVVGMVREDGALALSGTGFGSLFWPALSYANRVRRDKLRIRLYELALAQAKSSAEFAEILEAIFGDRRGS